MKKNNSTWHKYITRRLAVQVGLAWNYGWGEAMKKVYGVSITDTLIYRDSKKTEYYVDGEQFKTYVDGLYKLLKEDEFLHNFHKDAVKKLQEIQTLVQNSVEETVTVPKTRDLLSAYQNIILPNVEQFYIRMWTVFNIGEPLANTVKEKLAEHIKSEKTLSEYLLKASSPLEPNDVLNERINLLKIAIEKDSLPEEQFEEKIDLHTQRYEHIPMFDFDHEPYTKEHFKHELSQISNPVEELSKIKNQFTDHKKDFESRLDEFKKDDKLISLLHFMKENVWLRDYRDMIRQRLNLSLRKFYIAAGEKIGLSVEEIATLTNEEIIFYLKDEKLFSKDEVKKRKLSYLLIQKGEDIQIYSGDDATRQAQKELKTNAQKDINFFTGIIGSKGKATGPVVVVYTNKDLGKVKDGDILVAPITRQDFVPAIRKVKAMVIDEGSVTAHPAIIAREFGIPCIVATKVGTQILKDGDMIEVDAENGVVRKL